MQGCYLTLIFVLLASSYFLTLLSLLFTFNFRYKVVVCCSAFLLLWSLFSIVLFPYPGKCPACMSSVMLLCICSSPVMSLTLNPYGNHFIPCGWPIVDPVYKHSLRSGVRLYCNCFKGNLHVFIIFQVTNKKYKQVEGIHTHPTTRKPRSSFPPSPSSWQKNIPTPQTLKENNGCTYFPGPGYSVAFSERLGVKFSFLYE